MIDVRVDPYVKTCSNECRYKQMSDSQDREVMQKHLQETLQERYGVSNAMQIQSSKDKVKQTNLERYGTEWYTQTDEYKERVKQTDLEKYGYEHHLSSPAIIEKRQKTVHQIYGVNNVFQSDDVKGRVKQTNLDKYGVKFITQSIEIRQRIHDNNISTYGVSHPMKLPEFQEKAAQTNEKLYGRRAYTQQHISDIQRWYEFINDSRSYIESHYIEQPTSHQLAADLGVDYTTVDDYLKKHDSKDCIRRAKSLMEEELKQFIMSLDHNIRIVCNDRTAISPDELDLYLPDFNFAIECDPTCTHNSSAADPWGGAPKATTYHKKKSDKCDSIGLTLFHVFGYDWTYKKDTIKSMIQNVIGRNEETIYARKCIVKEVPGQDSINFLNANHRQGAANSPVRLGLYYNDELVSLMTFGKMRGTIGTGKEDLSECWELVRFCSKLNTSVVGGASKLFKHFIKLYQPKQIRSFSDRAHTRGNLYKQLGFVEVRRSEANYVWVDIKTDRAYHRVNAQKKNLKKFLKDENIDLSRSEKQIMEEHGFVQVYDSGTITWEWRA